MILFSGNIYNLQIWMGSLVPVFIAALFLGILLAIQKLKIKSSGNIELASDEKIFQKGKATFANGIRSAKGFLFFTNKRIYFNAPGFLQPATQIDIPNYQVKKLEQQLNFLPNMKDILIHTSSGMLRFIISRELEWVNE